MEAGIDFANSQYAEAINDVIKWRTENPEGWQTPWQLNSNIKFYEFDPQNF